MTKKIARFLLLIVTIQAGGLIGCERLYDEIKKLKDKIPQKSALLEKSLGL